LPTPVASSLSFLAAAARVSTRTGSEGQALLIEAAAAGKICAKGRYFTVDSSGKKTRPELTEIPQWAWVEVGRSEAPLGLGWYRVRLHFGRTLAVEHGSAVGYGMSGWDEVCVSATDLDQLWPPLPPGELAVISDDQEPLAPPEQEDIGRLEPPPEPAENQTQADDIQADPANLSSATKEQIDDAVRRTINDLGEKWQNIDRDIVPPTKEHLKRLGLRAGRDAIRAAIRARPASAHKENARK